MFLVKQSVGLDYELFCVAVIKKAETFYCFRHDGNLPIISKKKIRDMHNLNTVIVSRCKVVHRNDVFMVVVFNIHEVVCFA